MKTQLTGLILAGGEGRRMGGQDKGQLILCGKPMVNHVLQRLAPQVNEVIVSANRSMSAYSQLDCRVVADPGEGFQGPLAGMYAGLQATHTDYMLTVPVDSPCLPEDLGERLFDALTAAGADVAVAHDGERLHPVFCLLRATLKPGIRAFLDKGDRKIDRWFATLKQINVDFSDNRLAFANANTAEDMSRIERLMVSEHD